VFRLGRAGFGITLDQMLLAPPTTPKRPAAALKRVLNALGLVALAYDVRARLGYLADRRTRARNARFSASGAPDGLPLPPPRLVYAVAGHFDLEEFIESGHLHAELIEAVLADNDFDLDRLTSVLDFGCGCGRVVRHWRRRSSLDVRGCDRDERLIGWCRRSLDFAEFSVGRLDPPLPYANAEFDLVYAISVFTHLTEELQRVWIDELERVLAPGGVLLITTKGRSRIDPLNEDERQRFQRGELVVQDARYAGRNLCAAYHPEAYVREHLAVPLRVLDFVPAVRGGPHSQDIVLLQKPTSLTSAGAGR
jgi:SAM-dependent methyltransferase